MCKLRLWQMARAGQSSEGRDLALTKDFRSVVGEVLVRHIGVQDLRTVFPNFESVDHKAFGALPWDKGVPSVFVRESL
jgi:hypothetical protein